MARETTGGEEEGQETDREVLSGWCKRGVGNVVRREAAVQDRSVSYVVAQILEEWAVAKSLEARKRRPTG